MKISMKYLSKIFISAAFISTFSYAGMVDAISVIINNQPITLYEVYKYAHEFKVSTSDSLDLLIRKKLEEAEIKKLNITASDFEVDDYIRKLATKNGISEFQFYEMLKAKNIDETNYKKDLRKKLEQDKLYKKIIQMKGVKVTLAELQDFYQKNKAQFVSADGFSITTYNSKNRASLESIRKNPMLNPQDVQMADSNLKSGSMDQKLEALLNETKSGEFTPIYNAGDHFTMIYLKEKSGVKTIPFAKVKNYIYSVVSSKDDKAAINDYFDKLKSVADIKILRRPNS
ncbi:MAG: peptidyl-prolyl cis-trans isomerase [Sulfurospirillaceae bacterium]|nr:peptidyl-prolyl cis-trans isomerase [Sulfurospirillaceae bacterium]